MSRLRTIDTHTHILTEDAIALLQKELPKAGVRITPLDDANVTLEVGGTPYKPFPRGGFDVEHRLRDMDAAGVDVQVLSATPQTYLYNEDAAMAETAAAIQNDEIARLVKAKPDRFMGIATLPLQAPDRAAKELRRAMSTLGLRGTMIGSNAKGKNLDDPSFEPLWTTAAELGAFIFVHPVHVAGADRLTPYYLRNLIGNPLDTTIAAACLYFGGVFERHPKLTVCLAHGGGFTPYQAARWEHGWQVREEPKKNIKQQPKDIAGCFLYDTILHSKQMLELMIARVGVDNVLLGSDYPYDMAMLDCVAHVKSLDIPKSGQDSILNGRFEKLLAGQKK